MARRVNRRFLIRSVALLVLLAVGVHVVHAVQVRRQAAAMIHQARQAEADGELHRAAMYLNSYLAGHPEDTETLAWYARILTRSAATYEQTENALQVLEQVLRRDPDRRAEREEAVRLAAELALFDDVARHLEALRVFRDDKAEIDEARGWAYLGLGESRRAAEAFQDALRQSPERLHLYPRLAQLYFRDLGNPDRATAVMEDMVTANPRSAQALLARAAWREGRGLFADADADVARALDLAPKDVPVLLAAADYSRRRDRPEEARARLARGFAEMPDDPQLRSAAANLAWQEGRRPARREHLRKGLEHSPDNPVLLLQMAEVLLDDGDIADARKLRDRLAARKEPPLGLDYLDARLAMERNEWLTATRALEAARNADQAAQPWSERLELALARCYATLGDEPLRLQAAARAVRINPASRSARVAYAAALQANGWYEPAANAWRELLARPGVDPAAWVELGRCLLALQLRRPAGKRDWADAERACREASLTLADASPVLLLADVRAAQGRNEEAVRLLDAAIRLAPKSVELRVASIDLALARGQFAEAETRLADSRKAVGDLPALRVVAAHWIQRQIEKQVLNRGAAQHELQKLGQQLERFTPVEQGAVMSALADAWRRAGDNSRALELAQRWTRAQPDLLASWLKLFDLAMALDAPTAAEQAIAGLRRVEGENGVRWRVGEAQLALERARLGDSPHLAVARRRLDEANRTHPDWGRVYFLRAQLADLADRPEAAIAFYQRAFDAGERGWEVTEPLIRGLLAHDRAAEADRVLRRIEEIQPDLGPLARPAVEVARRLRQFRQAADLARRLVPADAPDYRDHLWLARILEEASQPEESEAVLRRAARQFPESPGVWVALVQSLARRGRKAEAASALQDAERHLHGTTAHLHLSRCYAALGRSSEAADRLEQALAAAPESVAVLRAVAEHHIQNDQPGRAAPILRAMLAAPEATPDLLNWARRELALALATTGTADAVREGLAVLGDPGGDESTADRRARALVLAQRPENRAEALRLLNDTLPNSPLTADEQFRIALLYDAANDRPHAREMFLSLLKEHPFVPQYLAGMTRVLLARGDVDEAGHWLARLEELEPDAARTRSLRAEHARKLAAASPTP